MGLSAALGGASCSTIVALLEEEENGPIGTY